MPGGELRGMFLQKNPPFPQAWMCVNLPILGLGARSRGAPRCSVSEGKSSLKQAFLFSQAFP